MELTKEGQAALEKIKKLAKENKIDIAGGKIRRTSSRFCLGVEHGDYNGTELFGVGTDRFLWMAYKPNGTDTVRLFSGNFPNDGVVEFKLGNVPEPKSPEIAHTWARFPWGADYILRRQGYTLTEGIDGVIFGNIPGGGMSRSASLSLNLILSLFDANPSLVARGSSLEYLITGHKPRVTSHESRVTDMDIVDLAQAVENDYIGSPCGKLDQIMILFAKEGMGTYYNPAKRSVDYVKLGEKAEDFRIVVMDTGTERPGLEKSTYKIRRSECEELVEILKKAGYKISCLADIKEQKLYDEIMTKFKEKHPGLCERMKYIFAAQQRFYEMLDAWKSGDIETVGKIFRADGIGLRDDYKISGPELETMCDIVRTVPGVIGERMLGGGDKGASGALVKPESVEDVRKAVASAYPRSRPEFADKYAVHICKVVDGVRVFEDLL